MIKNNILLQDFEVFDLLTDPNYDYMDIPLDEYDEYELDLLYSYNKNILYDKRFNFNLLSEKTKNHICKRNKYLDIDKYWNDFNENQRNILTTKHDFNFEKYWNSLTDCEKSNIYTFNPYLDVDKYWDDLKPQDIKYIINRKFNFTRDKIPKIISGFISDKLFTESYFFENIWSYGFYDKIIVYNETYIINGFKISELYGFKKTLFVEYLKTLDKIYIDNPEDMFIFDKANIWGNHICLKSDDLNVYIYIYIILNFIYQCTMLIS